MLEPTAYTLHQQLQEQAESSSLTIQLPEDQHCSDQLVAVAEGFLRQRNQVSEIELCFDHLHHHHARVLFDRLSTLSGVESFNFYGNEIDEGAISEYLHYLRDNQNIKTIGIFCKEMITPEFITSLGDVLKQKIGLETLYISEVNLASEHMSRLCEWINDVDLKEMILSNNSITNHGALQLARALTSNVNLSQLNLTGCEIPKSGISSLINALRSNTNLSSFVLNTGFLDQIQMAQLISVLATNRTLHHIDVSTDDSVTDSQWGRLTQLLDLNLAMQSDTSDDSNDENNYYSYANLMSIMSDPDESLSSLESEDTESEVSENNLNQDDLFLENEYPENAFNAQHRPVSQYSTRDEFIDEDIFEQRPFSF